MVGLQHKEPEDPFDGPDLNAEALADHDRERGPHGFENISVHN